MLRLFIDFVKLKKNSISDFQKKTSRYLKYVLKLVILRYLNKRQVPTSQFEVIVRFGFSVINLTRLALALACINLQT